MSALKDKISVTCPKCGHTQPEPRGAYSTICKKCRAHFRLGEPVSKPAQPTLAQRRVTCFQCGTVLEVAVAAASTMCKRCSSHVDLNDYQITATVSKNFRTYGRLIIEEKGYVLNTDSLVGEAVIRGRLIGKIVAKRRLEIYSTAQIKGSLTTGCLVVPAGQYFRWPQILAVGGAEIGGELVGNLQATGTVQLKSSGRLFGDVQAGALLVESGAVMVGAAKIGPAASAQGGPEKR